MTSKDRGRAPKLSDELREQAGDYMDAMDRADKDAYLMHLAADRIDELEAEVEWLGGLGVAVYCNGCDFGLTVIDARHVGHGRDGAPVCHECGHKSWRQG